jgi:CzcA family heavy metal efflux pump
LIDAILAWSLRNRLLVIVGALLVSGWGAWETLHRPVDVFPDLTAPTVTVLADAHDMAPVELETLVTMPIEAALTGMPGVRRVRSATSVGLAVFWVEFDWSTDVYRARQAVSERLDLVRSGMPSEMTPPILGPVTSIMGEVMFLGLRTTDPDGLMRLRTTADVLVKRRLQAVEGVAQVLGIGGELKQFQVVLRPGRMADLGVSATEIADALAEGNINASAGVLIERGQESLIQGFGRIRTLEDISEILVTMRDGQPLRINDVATVQVGPAFQRGQGGFNGERAVVLAIQKQPGVNTLALTERLDDALDSIEGSLPDGITLHRDGFRQADFIAVAIANVTSALRDGAFLVVLVILLFLASLRATLIAALAIPLSLLAAVLAMAALGITVNTMTLGGMAIAVGALVDDAIIDVENVVRRLRMERDVPPEQQRPTGAIVLAASREIRSSIVFATLVIGVVFLPLFFLEGVEGRLLAPLGLAYLVALGASLLVAITVTPVLCALFLPNSKAVARDEEPRPAQIVKAMYRPLLSFILPRWKLVTVLSIIGFGAAAYSASHAGRDFLPPFNEGALTVGIIAAPGTSLRQSDALGRMAEHALLLQPEVVSTTRRTGRAEGDEHAMAVNASEVEVVLAAGGRSRTELLSAVREALSAVPGVNAVLGQPISHRIDHMLSGVRSSIAVKIFGPHLSDLRRLAKRAEALMADIPGVVDLQVEQQRDVPMVTLDFKRGALARHGLTMERAATALEIATTGHEVTRILEGQAAYDLVVRYPLEVGKDLDALRNVLVTTPTGAQVPLHALANIRRDAGPNTVSREDGQRRIIVMANVADRDVTSVVADIQSALHEDLALPSGYHLDFGGQFESADRAAKTLGVLGAVVVVVVFLLLFMAFGSARDAWLGILNLPLSLMGGIVGVWLGGGVISVASLIGFITLFGIATRNGVMIITHVHHLVTEEGITSPLAAVQRAATERLVPILMTAAASGLGLLPLALAAGEPGSEIQAPMAQVILWGLLSATLLNLIVVPALYLRFGAAVKGMSEPTPQEAV